VTSELKISHVCRVDCPPIDVWHVLGEFTDLKWLPGPESVTIGEHEGQLARILHFQSGSGIEPIIEYLLSKDDQLMTFEYGVIKHAFVPVEGYRARVSVSALELGAEISFTGTYTERVSQQDEVNAMLKGAYQMMGECVGRYVSERQS
jgi:hypothetical protein